LALIAVDGRRDVGAERDSAAREAARAGAIIELAPNENPQSPLDRARSALGSVRARATARAPSRGRRRPAPDRRRGSESSAW
jgi:hypothetical protein